MKRRSLAVRGPWAVPVGLAALSAFGLLSALLGDGVFDLLSWFALAVPVVVCLRYGMRRRTASEAPRASRATRRRH